LQAAARRLALFFAGPSSFQTEVGQLSPTDGWHRQPWARLGARRAPTTQRQPTAHSR
jgi:hypothetical protein